MTFIHSQWGKFQYHSCRRTKINQEVINSSSSSTVWSDTGIPEATTLHWTCQVLISWSRLQGRIRKLLTGIFHEKVKQKNIHLWKITTDPRVFFQTTWSRMYWFFFVSKYWCLLFYIGHTVECKIHCFTENF